jgi:hypothetical protein
VDCADFGPDCEAGAPNQVDNLSMKYVPELVLMSQRTKHLEIHYLFICQLLIDHPIVLKWVLSVLKQKCPKPTPLKREPPKHTQSRRFRVQDIQFKEWVHNSCISISKYLLP